MMRIEKLDKAVDVSIYDAARYLHGTDRSSGVTNTGRTALLSLG